MKNSWRFLIHISSNSGDSKDGDGGNGNIKDSFVTSNSKAESSSKPNLSDAIT